MTFLLDENFPPQVAAALQALELPFTHSTEHFARGITDEDLFKAIKERDWCLVTRDRRMWKNKAQRKALLEAGLGVFIHVSTTRVTPPQLTQMLLSRVDEMRDIARRHKLPFVMRIADRGKIESF